MKLSSTGIASTLKLILHPKKIKILEETGFAPAGYFVLPESSWIDYYYQQMEERFDDFLKKHDNLEIRSAEVDSHYSADIAEIRSATVDPHYSVGFAGIRSAHWFPC